MHILKSSAKTRTKGRRATAFKKGQQESQKRQKKGQSKVLHQQKALITQPSWHWDSKIPTNHQKDTISIETLQLFSQPVEVIEKKHWTTERPWGLWYPPVPNYFYRFLCLTCCRMLLCLCLSWASLVPQVWQISLTMLHLFIRSDWFRLPWWRPAQAGTCWYFTVPVWTWSCNFYWPSTLNRPFFSALLEVQEHWHWIKRYTTDVKSCSS